MVRDVVRLPNPWMVPVVSVVVAGQLLGMSRSVAYRAAARGDLPTVAGVGGRQMVSVFMLYRMLGAPVPPRPITPAVGERR